jgi:putative addiction module killer protein
MLIVRTTVVFDKWFGRLRDRRAKASIQVRIDRLELGNFGQHRELKSGVGEMKIDVGPGYRVYYTRRGTEVVILICGGDKSSQSTDIKRAMELAKQL